jgi:tripartite-type tricarboxylate transporter receptor subunit TctC
MPDADQFRKYLSAILAPILALILSSSATVNAVNPIETATSPCESLAGKDIQFIVSSKPGGAYDTYARLLQPFLEQALSANIRIVNRAEAGGAVAALNLRDGRPDGTILGLLNAPGLMVAAVVGSEQAVDPATELSVLARVVDDRYVVFSAAESSIANVADLYLSSASGPILIGVRDVGSSNFLVTPIMADLLGLDLAPVSGYSSSGARILAAIRGEVDIIIRNYDSVRRYIKSGELLPLLQINGSPVDGSRNVPSLFAEASADSRRNITGKSAADVGEDLGKLDAIVSSGRVIVAPPNLPDSLQSCIGDILQEILHDETMAQAAQGAGLRIASASREEARDNIRDAAEALQHFRPLLNKSIASMRN